ncbi:peroxidase [Catellatospora sp. IY07-71]|uniref:Dyp-type peroxidase n=1 Tax=Catellatospora sp. IY07-71 TaxID=2728827 RepID=UPI001BB2F468|nr:Dyp-type peroxidase [Catellatospora sp. IY07-71]BCJ75965.1 peroxidase [Catellatospora sp. IY07-71]
MQLELDDIQGLIIRGYGTLPAARFHLLAIDRPQAARASLRRLLPRVTCGQVRPTDAACNLAFTADGLAKLGVSTAPESGFATEFATGITDPDRSLLLGDIDTNAPGHWRWGGPATAPVHLAVLTWAKTQTRLNRLTTALRRDLVGHGFTETATLDTAPLTDREPFGFADGISQPAFEGLPAAAADPAPVRAGEFLLGYENEYGLLTDRPLLPLGPDTAGLPTFSGRADLGRNGSYLVLRQLRQDVDAFSAYLDEATRQPDGSADPHRRALLAAKMVGRWPSGAPLVLSPDADHEELAKENDFAYRAADPQGLLCPIGAHIRRANPRDSLNTDLSPARAQQLNRRHRLLRRGRVYGPIPDENGHDEVGLHFLCIGANLARQFEFVQHTWLNNPNFNGLYADPDPLVGARVPGTTFTEQALPLRRRHRELPQFVSTRGGAYFFMPGMRALHYLSSPERSR